MHALGQRSVSRRHVLKRSVWAACAIPAGFGLLDPKAVQAQSELLTVTAGGVNVKRMPSPDGSATVPLRESFSLSPSYAQCLIEDNPDAFAMDTFTMGRVVVEAHQFFMAMYATRISLVRITGGADGSRVATLRGTLDCHTFAGTASVSVGSRTLAEPASFEILAVDAGPNGGESGDSFAFTVFFDATASPVNYAIFGPKPTFTGELVAGEVTIAPAIAMPLEE